MSNYTTPPRDTSRNNIPPIPRLRRQNAHVQEDDMQNIIGHTPESMSTPPEYYPEADYSDEDAIPTVTPDEDANPTVTPDENAMDVVTLPTPPEVINLVTPEDAMDIAGGKKMRRSRRRKYRRSIRRSRKRSSRRRSRRSRRSRN